MPKVPTDDAGEISDVSEVAHDGSSTKPADASNQPPNGAADNDSSDSGDDGEEEYAVESIVSHRGLGKNLRYEIKWVGYSADENTFEPVDNLLPDAAQILSAYHREIGFDPATQKGKDKGSKPSNNLKRTGSDSPAPTKRAKKGDDSADEGSWLPKTEDWEKYVDSITHIEKDPQTSQLVVFIEWKNGKKTKVSMSQVYQHCPRPMLRFYEQHLKFTNVD